MAETTNDRVYWAHKKGEQFLGAVKAKKDRYYEDIETVGLIDLWRRSERTYRGLDPSGGYKRASSVTYGGEANEIVLFSVNHVGSMGRGVQSLITATRPAARAVAHNNNPEATEAALLADEILEYDRAHKGLEPALVRAAQFNWVYGEAWLVQTWKDSNGVPVLSTGKQMLRTGGVELDVLGPHDVVRDLMVPSNQDQDAPWLMTRHRVNRWDLAEQYPLHREAIVDEQGASQHKNEGLLGYDFPKQDQEDYVYLYRIHHAPSEAMPFGMQASFIDSALLEEPRALVAGRVTARRMMAERLEHLNFGFSVCFDLLAIQQAYDAVVNTVQTNLEAGGQVLWSHAGDENIDIDDMRAMKHIKSITKPEAISLTEQPEGWEKQLDMLRTSGELISGMNSVARGAPDTTYRSGQALALVQAMAIQFNGSGQRAYGLTTESVLNDRLELYRRFATVDQVVYVTGRDVKSAVKTWKGDQLKGVACIKVELADPMALTSQGRFEKATLWLQNGLITSPDQFMQVEETGRLDPVLKGSRSQERRIQYENDALIKGESVEAIEFDNHILHLQEHVALFESPEAINDPRIAGGAADHIMSHFNMLEMLAESKPWIPEIMGYQIPPSLAQLIVAMQAPPPEPGASPGAAPKGEASAPKQPGQVPASGVPDPAGMPDMPTNPATGEPAGPVI